MLFEPPDVDLDSLLITICTLQCGAPKQEYLGAIGHRPDGPIHHRVEPLVIFLVDVIPGNIQPPINRLRFHRHYVLEHPHGVFEPTPFGKRDAEAIQKAGGLFPHDLVEFRIALDMPRQFVIKHAAFR